MLPGLKLAPYQRAWLIDRAPRKIFVKSRRIGGSFVVALENALAVAGYGKDSRQVSYYRPERGVDQLICSAGHLQAMALLGDVHRCLRAIELVIGKRIIDSKSATRITLKNGRKVLALPANPRTVRGFTGDLTLDEFAAMPHSDEMWAAASAIASPTLGRPFGYKLRIVGTPLGDDNRFYRIAKTETGDSFSRHFVDCHTAIAQGFPTTVERLREQAGDADTFAQEYECQFISASTRYISAELYDSCTYEEDDVPEHGLRSSFAGMDVGRRSHGDPSVIARVMKSGDTLYHRSTESRRGVEFNAQELWAESELAQCTRLAIDATGLGMDLAERLVKKHGSRVEAIEFTQKSKEMLATGLHGSMSRGKLKVLRGDAELRRSVLSLRKNITAHGNTTFDAERTKKGHADAAWALALAVHTAGTGLGQFTGVDVVGSRDATKLDRL